MARYEVRFIHPIAPRHTDRTIIELPGDGDFVTTFDAAARRSLGAALRKAGVLLRGQSVREARRLPEGTLAVFPSRVPGGWHCMVLRRHDG